MRQSLVRPLLGDAASRAARILLVGCAVLVAALGVWVAHRSQPDALDRSVDSWVYAWLNPHHHRFIKITRDIGNPSWVTLTCAVLVLPCLLTRRVRVALLVAVAVPLAGGITEFALKHLIDRTMGGLLAFPSGHVTGVSALAAVVMVALFGPSRPPLPGAIRWLLAAVAIAVVVVLALALIAWPYHYFTDTIGGAAVGTGTVLGTALVLDWLWARWLRNQRGGAAVATSMTQGHQITITPADAHIEVSVGGTKLADSTRAVVLAETGLPPRYYLPREDVRADLLRPTSTQTTCPFKGQAEYWSAEVGGEVYEDVVWSYGSPIPDAAGIAGLMCFYNERVELTVDGEHQPGVPAATSH